jgi:hypothetical protein
MSSPTVSLMLFRLSQVVVKGRTPHTGVRPAPGPGSLELVSVLLLVTLLG